MPKREAKGELAEALPLVGRVARRMAAALWHRPPPSDLASLGMLTLFDAAQRYDPERAAFAPYLVERLRWAMLSEARQRARRHKLLAAAGVAREPLGSVEGRNRAHGEDEEALAPQPDDAADPEREMDRAHSRRRVRSALGRLPSKTRQILVRHYFGAERFDAIAGELGVSKATVARLHRNGKQQLAARLADLAPRERRLR